MRESFEKARDEKWNKIKILRKVHTWNDGADWAFEWCMERPIGQAISRQLATIDQQAKIIDLVKSDLKEIRKFLSMENGIDLFGVKARLFATLAKVEEMESKTP